MSRSPCLDVPLSISKRLALGTVQFGLDYGIANRHGQVTFAEANAIIKCSRASGMDTLDTAIGYGDSERRLGEIGVRDWKVISKLPAVPEGCDDVAQWVDDSVNESLRRLNIGRLYGLLLHRPQQLLERYGEELYRALRQLRQDGVVKKIGISIYDPSELDTLLSPYQLDLVQAPFNLIDRRLIESGSISRLKERKVELHVRSVFLQGLLLMDYGDRPKWFDRWRPLWCAYDKWLRQVGITPLQACLRYVLSFQEIGKVVIGVDNSDQLKEILSAISGPLPPEPPALRTSDLDLLNPARWRNYG